MPHVGWMELVLILGIALLIFGPSRLAGIGSAMGRAIKEFRGAVRDAEDEMEKSTTPDKRS